MTKVLVFSDKIRGICGIRGEDDAHSSPPALHLVALLSVAGRTRTACGSCPGQLGKATNTVCRKSTNTIWQKTTNPIFRSSMMKYL